MRGVSLAYNIYIANIVGAEIIGVFSLIMSIYTFAITFATSGIGIACTYITSEEFAKKNYENGFKAVKTCSSFSFMLGLFASLVIILFAPILSTYIKNTRGDRSLIQIAVSILPYIVKLNSFAKKKNMAPIPIEKTIAIFKIVLHTFRILLVFLLASNLENSGIIRLLKDIIKTLAKSNIGITIPSYHTIF